MAAVAESVNISCHNKLRHIATYNRLYMYLTAALDAWLEEDFVDVWK